MSWRAAAALALLPLGSCSGDWFKVCRACIATPPTEPVADADRARIRFIGPGALPAGARNLYYDERCGIDCTHWMRFELPEAEARRFAAGVLGGVALRGGGNPFAGGASAYRGPDKAMPWWPAHFPADAEGARIADGQGRGAAVMLRAEKGQAMVWFFEFDM